MSAAPVRIGLLGSSGRMGQWVSRLLREEFAGRAELVAQAGRAEAAGGDWKALLAADAVIDFSLPEAAVAFAKAALAAGGPLPALVVGSTGWKLDQRKELEALSAKTPVLMSSNFSTGVLALLEVLKQASPMLEKLGYTPVIAETHHRHKKDSPSGTALSLQRAIAPAGPGNVQTVSVRAGEIVGDHEITFYGPGDHLTLGHFAQDRSIFARGAIGAAIWLAGTRGAADRKSGILGIDAYFRELSG